MTIQEAQETVDNWIRKYGVRYFNELTNMAILTEEVGEVLFILICITNQTGTDLELALQKNLQKKTTRDFDRHQQNDKL